MAEGLTQKLRIQLLHAGVFMRESKLPITIVLIQALGTLCADVVGYPVGLTTAAGAASRAGHNFNKVIG